MTAFRKVLTPKACTYAGIFPHSESYVRSEQTFQFKYFYNTTRMGWDSVEGVATPYGLEVSGFKLRCGQEISLLHARPDRSWDSHSPLCNRYRGSFPRVKGSGRGVDHPPHCSAEVKSE